MPRKTREGEEEQTGREGKKINEVDGTLVIRMRMILREGKRRKGITTQ